MKPSRMSCKDMINSSDIANIKANIEDIFNMKQFNGIMDS